MEVDLNADVQGRKLLSGSQSQEISQGTKLAPDWLDTLVRAANQVPV